jgi:mannose-6-phosphate isomerase-like protein (cupin superfamily)
MSVRTEPEATTARARGRSWLALDVLVTELSSEENGGPVVAEGTLPEGASPPLHVHHDLDDSFYLLDGQMVLRCGDEVSVAGPGEWVPFPRGVPHTFRVMGGPARVLMVHANDSFMGLVRELGQTAEKAELSTPTGGPSLEVLSRAMAAHDISTVGPCMEEGEAQALLAALANG